MEQGHLDFGRRDLVRQILHVDGLLSGQDWRRLLLLIGALFDRLLAIIQLLSLSWWLRRVTLRRLRSPPIEQSWRLLFLYLLFLFRRLWLIFLHSFHFKFN